jgi:hypothetical protein
MYLVVVASKWVFFMILHVLLKAGSAYVVTHGERGNGSGHGSVGIDPENAARRRSRWCRERTRS